MSVGFTYLLNVALHAVILSVLASGMLAIMRRPSQRSFTAVVGLLAVGILPWLTALRPAAGNTDVSSETAAPVAALPVWTVVKMKAPEPQPQSTLPPLLPASAQAVAYGPTAEEFDWPALPEIFVTLWAMGTVTCMLLSAATWLRVQAWGKRLVPVDDGAWEKIAPHTGGKIRRSTFLIGEERSSPCVTGWWCPRIVLPRFLMEENFRKELGWALRHEAGHWQAGDSRWMILFCLIRNVNWWNPLVVRLLSRWEDSREQVCDLRAAGMAEHRADYGEFLIAMAKGVTCRTPMTVTMARSSGSQLRKRIRFLLGAKAGAEKPMGKIPLGLVCMGFATAAILISGARIYADETPAKKLDSLPPTIDNVLREKVKTTVETATTFSLSTTDESPAVVPDQQPSKWKITTEIVFTPPGFLAPKVVPDNLLGAMDDVQASTNLERLTALPGSTRITPAAVAATGGQETKVELFWPVAGKQGPSTDQDPFLGIKLKMIPEILGGEMELRISSDYRYFPGIPEPIGMIQDGRGNLPPHLDPGKVKIVNRDVTLSLRPGETRYTELGQDEQGRSLCLFTKAEVIATEKSAPSTFPLPSGPAKRQIKISTNFIITDTAMGFMMENPVFAGHQMDTIMRALSQKKGTDLATVPSLTALSGQQARIEMIRETPGSPDQISKRNSDMEVPFVGVRSVYTSSFINENSSYSPDPGGYPEPSPSEFPMDLAYDVEYRFVPGVYQSLLNKHATPPTDLNPETIRSIKKSIKCQMNAGMTMGMNLGEIEKGRFLSVLVRLDAIDATGRPLLPSKPAPPVKTTDSSPSPDTKGKLRLRGTIVEIPTNGGPVAGSAPAYPTVAEAILKIPGAKSRKLKTAEIPLFERAVPWPEAQALKISAIASKDFTRVTLARWTFDGTGEFPETWMDLATGSTMNISLPSDNPAIDRRILIQIEPLR